MNTEFSNSFNEGSLTIYEALQNIQNGKYTMPAFQRQYVWNLSQIEKLWDSILADYPIANFLFWRLNEKILSENVCFCDFLSLVSFRASRHEPASNNYSLASVDLATTNIAILDGQQRLTSLFISLLGDVIIRPRGAQTDNNASVAKLCLELDSQKSNRDVEDDDDDDKNQPANKESRHEYNAKKYDFNFVYASTDEDNTKFYIKDLVKDPQFRSSDLQVRKQAIADALHSKDLSTTDRQAACALLEKLCAKIFDERLIHYTELCNQDFSDALEIFLRFNNGGRPLKKSDITMSILEAYWPKARERFGKEALIGEYEDFNSEFLLRLALMIYGKVDGVIDAKTACEFKDNWPKFLQALKHTQKMLATVKIGIPHFSKSWNVLIPVIYAVYYDSDWADKAEDAKVYLARATLFNHFENGTTGKLRAIQEKLPKTQPINLSDLKNTIPTTKTEVEKVLEAEKGSSVVAGALYYLGLDWINPRVHHKNGYDQDHMHPETRFRQNSNCSVVQTTFDQWKKLYNKLPNLQLLTQSENRTIKQDDDLIEYYKSKTTTEQETLRCQGMFPDGAPLKLTNEALLELKNFNEFYATRKELLRQKISDLVKLEK